MQKVKTSLKKTVSVFLSVLILLTVAPIDGLAELDLFGIKAKADDLFQYGKYYYYPEGTQFISSIRYGQAEKSVDATSEATQDNYTKLDVDLNSGVSGSDYIFLGYKTSTNIIDSVATYFRIGQNTSGSFDQTTYFTVNGKSLYFYATAFNTSGMQDLNADAGGDYIYLYATTNEQAGLPVTAISASASTEFGAKAPSGYLTVKQNNNNTDSDCNAGAGGDYVYIYFDNTSAYTDVTAEVMALKEKVEAAENLRQSDYTADSWANYDPSLLVTAKNYLNIYESNIWNAGYITPQELKSACNDLDNALNALVSTTYTRNIKAKGHWNFVMSEIAKNKGTWDLVLSKDIFIYGAAETKLAAIPAGVTVNLNMNGNNIRWDNVDYGNDDIMSYSYPLSDDYWGLITNNGTLNIQGAGTIKMQHVRYNHKNDSDRDNYGAKVAAIVNSKNAHLSLGSNIAVQSYLGQANTDGNKYQDMFLYAHGVYNEGIVDSCAKIDVCTFSGGSLDSPIFGGSTNSWVYAYSCGIFGGTVNVLGGYINSEAKSGFLDSASVIYSRGNRVANFATGVYSDNAKIKGNASITTTSTSWRNSESRNIWRDGTNMSWSVGVMYSKDNYPIIDATVNISSTFRMLADETFVTLPGLNEGFVVSSESGSAVADRRAYAVAGIKASMNPAMYGGQTYETIPDSGSVFGLGTEDVFPVTDYRSEYFSGGLITSSDNYVQTGNNVHEFLTSRIENGFPAGSGNVNKSNNFYSAGAAVEYARRYALSYNKEWFFYINGGDCANYVSQALLAGGYQFDADWFSYDGVDAGYRTESLHTWIRADELMHYLADHGGVVIQNPSPSDFSLGDAVFYDWERNGHIDHSAIVTAIDNGVPKVSAHTTPESASKLDYHWTYGADSNCCYLVKLNGNPCYNDNANSYSIYKIKNNVGFGKVKIMSKPGGGTEIATDKKNLYFNSVVRVIKEQDGWGYFNYYGTWGWIDLSLCNKVGTFNKIEVSHSMTGWYTHLLSTCKTPGIKLNTCTKCDYFEKQEIAKKSHTYKDATCTTSAYCTMCGTTKGSPLGHNWNITETAPTCVKQGERKHNCLRCGIEKTEKIATVDHKWGSFATTTPPSCTQDGVETSTCSVCSKTTTKPVDKLGHNMQTITVNSTCLVEGTTTSRCTRCDYTEYSDTTAALGHDYVATVTVATCTENGYTTYKCSRCNDTYTDSVAQWSALTDTFVENAPADKIQEENGQYRYVQEAWDHDFAVTDSAEATCTEAGYTTKTCSRCQLEKTENIDALGHDWGEWTDNTDGTHSRICARDESHVETLEHVWYDGTMTVAPTCETEGTMEYTCEICGGMSTETIEPIGHDYYLDEDMSVAPTCEENGYDYYVCANNPEHNYKEEHAATGHNMSEQIDHAPETGCGEGKKVSECTKDDCDYYEEEYYFLEHSYGEKIEVLGNCNIESYSYIECEKCHESLMFAGELVPDNHADYGTVVVDAVDPTCTEDGYTGNSICEKCSVVIESGTTIPALSHDMSDWSTNNDATHSNECQRENCDYEATEDCVFSEWQITQNPTCTEKGSKERTCTECGYIETADVAPTDHAWDDGVIDPSSTCKDHGTKTYTCQNDASHKYTEEVPLDENNHVGETYIKDNKDATCTEDGYTGDTYCSDCNVKISDGEVVPALTHDMGNWYIITEATCTEKGLEKRECQRNNCDYSEERETAIDADNHYAETFYTVDKKADCENDGTKSHHCERCDEPLDEFVISKRNHTYNNGVETTAPTCTEAGVKTYTCTNTETEEYEACTHSYTDVVPATGHDWSEWNTVTPATCTEDGLEKRICKNDADHVEENVLTAIGHDYHLIAEKSKAPDYGVAGYDYYECSYDVSHNYTETIDPLVKTKYTATFVVTAPFFDEDKTVGTVIFEQGDKYVDEPSVESYKNYTFAWDEYELNDEDIVIYGRYTEIEIDGVSDLETNKNATYNNGIASITLEAKSATKNIKVLSENTKPVDVILVLDQSGSMEETLGGTKTTKHEALINCANSFVNELYENAVATGADHRVALVGFAYSDYNNGNYENTGILATTQGKSYNYEKLTDTAYKTALIPVVSDNGINKYITNGINNVAASGATAADLGLEIANDIYAVTENDGTRERIVIFITDGTPTSWGETTKLVEDTSAAAITQANRLKNQQCAKIYSVGVHANADPTAKFTTVDSGVTTDNRNNFKSFDFNRFLHAVSSNYPESGSMKISDLGEGSKDSGYYMGVNDTSNLSNIFSKILYSAVYEINTFDKVTLVDTISKEFTLTLEQEAAMRENLAATLGIKNEDISVIRNADGTTTVKFANVRATKVYNTDGSSYYSASVSFDVSADADSLGGGKVATNTDDAYVDLGGTNIGSFTVPTVNIEQNRNIVVFTINGVVYRIDEVNLGDNVVAPESELAKWNIAQDTLVTENCAYFEASEVSDAKYTVTWISEGKQETQIYTFGSTITAPEAGEKDEYDFIKWSPDVPATMPAHNMTFTAVYATEHTHSFKKSNVYGDCEGGRTTVYVCSCGETKKETTEPTTHTCEAVVAKTNNGTLIERVSCTVCGKYVEQNLTYKVSYSQNKKTTVLDLSLYENEVLVQPDGTLKIMFYLGNATNKNYTVYRIDEDGKTTKYTPEKKNGYLIFEVDHFSIYVISEIDSATEKPAEDIDYNEALCVLNGHNYVSEVTEATCLLNGYTTYICSDCGDTYTADETEATGHTDANSDGKCDVCAASTTDDCNCTCHKTGFMGFIWKILRFLYKIFRINKTCHCGVAHW